MAIYQLLYASGATGPVAQADLDAILTSSRRNNAAVGVTGMLLYADGAFIQVLEGDKKDVRRFVDRISSDRRHRNFMVLYEGEVATRAFADWQMGFRKLDPARERDAAIFRATKEAVASRIDTGNHELVFDMVIAFGRDFLAS